jgi:phospholipase C
MGRHLARWKRRRILPRIEPLENRRLLADIHTIQHVVIIMQENRSFDSYFGTYPNADGPPADACVPDPATGDCVAPYHTHMDLNLGGAHQFRDAVQDIDGGLMDGFLRVYRRQHPTGAPQVMGYHDRREIPNYWAYADNFVLQEHMFEPQLGWSKPSHLYLVSGWSATCSDPTDPLSCVNNPRNPGNVPNDDSLIYGWTDLSYLLTQNGVSWRYYNHTGTPGIWNPLPHFTTVHDDGELDNIVSANLFFQDAAAGTLPAVSWVAPNSQVSEHPPALVSAGQAWVTSLVNAVMTGPNWDSTAIFISWDDWGGFYDHVTPPPADKNGYGLRVPGLLVSPWARHGYIDPQTLSFDAYLKFIEDDFLGGQRIDPKTDGRSDRRPDVRENSPLLGDLVSEFDFGQAPQRPLILPLQPTVAPFDPGEHDINENQDDEETLPPQDDSKTDEGSALPAQPVIYTSAGSGLLVYRDSMSSSAGRVYDPSLMTFQEHQTGVPVSSNLRDTVVPITTNIMRVSADASLRAIFRKSVPRQGDLLSPFDLSQTPADSVVPTAEEGWSGAKETEVTPLRDVNPLIQQREPAGDLSPQPRHRRAEGAVDQLMADVGGGEREDISPPWLLALAVTSAAYGGTGVPGRRRHTALPASSLPIDRAEW